MKVFISSLISGMETFRQAAVDAVEDLGHVAVTAETFEASSEAPRIACLNGVRSSNLVVLILSERYGLVIPPGDLSATHEEYREAKGSKPVLAFIQLGLNPEPKQAAFIKEVEDWESGHFRGSFSEPADLRKAIVRAIHHAELAAASAPVDADAMLVAATGMISEGSSRWNSSSMPQLKLSIVGGPAQSLLRPTDIENPDLARELMQLILFGECSFFDPAKGTDLAIEGGTLRLEQKSGDFFTLDEQGRMAVASSWSSVADQIG